ncbi:MAG: hypothetical protein LC657_08335 [Desulfobacteraceae bacterium]|nr:hypothetical protein [Desulfobacteraceae bacterium]
MSKLKKNPWEMTTDEYFGKDTAIVCEPGNLKKDYAGQVVFMNVLRDVKERLANIEKVKWADVIDGKQGSAILYAERAYAAERKQPGEETVFYKIPDDANFLNVTTKEYLDFVEWSNTFGNNGTSAMKLQEFGGYNGWVASQGKATVIYINNDYCQQGQVYPIERRALVTKALEKGLPVPMDVEKQLFVDQVIGPLLSDFELSDQLESEYLNPPNEFKVRWEIDLAADTPEEAAQKALEIMRDPESIATFFTVENSSTGKEIEVDLDLEDLDCDSGPGM